MDIPIVELSPEERRLVLEQLRQTYKDRGTYLYTEVVLVLAEPSAHQANLLLTMVCAAADAKRIKVPPSSTTIIDDQKLVLTWLVPENTPPEFLELLRQRMAKQVYEAVELGVNALRAREESRANAH